MTHQIFIGGSGRCGTTLLLEVLGKHKDIYNLPIEMRFITDPDGLINLVDSLTRNYCPFIGREALYRFHKLMTVDLCRPRQRPYLSYHLPGLFEKNFYSERRQAFFNLLTEYEFEGRSYFEVNEENPESERRILGARFFPNREELLGICTSFVDDLFMKAANDNGKSIWCEKTPFNVLHMDFLWELFPDSAVIHIFRDPRAVVLSMIQPSELWAPSNVHDAALLLKNFYLRLFDLKKKLGINDASGRNQRKYIEIKYEDLVLSPKKTSENLMEFLELKMDFDDLPPLKVNRADAWRKDLTMDQIKVIESVMGMIMDDLGYEKIG